MVIEGQGGHNPDEGEAPQGSWVTVLTYAEPDSCLASRRAAIDAGVRLIAYVGPVGELAERVVEESDWRTAHARHLRPLAVGKRLFVVPAWEDCEVPAGREEIRLEPGLGFGTGHHPTTSMCLALMEDLVVPRGSVLDIGCGSGILSIAAAKLGASRVLGLDVDEQAVSAARANIRRSGVEGAAAVVEGTVPAAAGGRQYDLVVANISASVLTHLAGDIATAIRSGGSLLASGVVAGRGPQVNGAFQTVGLTVGAVRQSGDWLAISARRTG